MVVGRVKACMQCIGMVVGYVGSSGMVFLLSDFLFFIFLNFDCVTSDFLPIVNWRCSRRMKLVFLS